MKRHHGMALALASYAAILVTANAAEAQLRARQRVARQGASTHRYAQNSVPQPPAPVVEELPPGKGLKDQTSAPPGSGLFSDDHVAPESLQPGGPAYFQGGGPYGFDPGGCPDGCCNSYGDCCDPYGGCCESGGSNSGWCCLPCCGGNERDWFFNADYISARAHFSEGVSFVERTITTSPVQESRDVFNEFDFDAESTYRLGGGVRLSNCGDEVRFLYTRLESTAEDSTLGVQAPNLFLMPFVPNAINPNAANPLLRGQGEMQAYVDVDSYDLEYRKTTSFGGSNGGCGDPCGCGEPCGCGCPTWDISWSGGVRAADVNWGRAYNYFSNDPAPLTSGTNNFSRFTTSTLEFEGVGPRVGVEGRRFFGSTGWFSLFVKGNVSLLWGDLEQEVRQRTLQDPSDATEDVYASQFLESREVIPVTELEAGVAANITKYATLSAGYLITSWHDLGFRDEYVGGSDFSLDARYDDANILSFDGLFARAELAF